MSGAQKKIVVGDRSETIRIADMNGGGMLDLVTANIVGNYSFVAGTGNAGFAAPIGASAGSTPSGVAVGDWNGDKLPDLAVSALLGNAIYLFTSQCN